MDGQPVWLASLALRNTKGLMIPTSKWSDKMRMAALTLIEKTLDGVGDTSRERIFRMCMTMCKHRAATAEEVAGQSPAFREARAIGIAGGPVEVLWENTPGSLSTKPCENMTQIHFSRKQPELFLPGDCGECGPCRARKSIETYEPYDDSAMALAQ